MYVHAMKWSKGENFEACDYDDFLDQSLDSPCN